MPRSSRLFPVLYLPHSSRGTLTKGFDVSINRKVHTCWPSDEGAWRQPHKGIPLGTFSNKSINGTRPEGRTSSSSALVLPCYTCRLFNSSQSPSA